MHSNGPFSIYSLAQQNLSRYLKLIFGPFGQITILLLKHIVSINFMYLVTQ